jgi:hypothetical protein
MTVNIVSVERGHFLVDGKKLELVNSTTAEWLARFDANNKPLPQIADNADRQRAASAGRRGLIASAGELPSSPVRPIRIAGNISTLRRCSRPAPRYAIRSGTRRANP